MGIPDEIKENVRAVLLSKTDGSGILVSVFLKDYKAMIFEPLRYKAYGYETLEKFINDIPDVCRLEYSDVHMAYKLFGIAKPNTFVSSFVKRAEGSSEDSETSRKSSKRLETVRPSNNLSEKWEPSARGLYTLCFPNKKGFGLDTKEAVARKFAQLGEVVEINIIPSLTFIRYREEKAAKMAVELYGDELRLRRADERIAKSSGQRKDKNNMGNSPGSVMESPEKKLEKSPPGLNAALFKQTSERKENHRVMASDINDENWDDDDGNQKQSPGWESSNIMDQKKQSFNVDTGMGNHGVKSPNRGRKDEERRGSKKDAGDHQTSLVQVYIGNWPNEAEEGELQALLKPYDCIGCRILQAKDSKMKKFAFVDFKEEKEALRVIKDLNNTVYRNRDLQCRLGKKKGTATDRKEKVKKGSIEQEFERLSVHKGIPELDKGMPTPDTTKQGNKKITVSHKNQCVETQEMPHLESPKMPPLESPKMPPLESPKMPLLETSYSRNTSSQLSPCESHDMSEMPPLEKVVSPAIPSSVIENRLKGMPNLEELSPKSHINGVADQSAYIPVQLNIGNFPYGTSERELMMLMGQFGAQRITVMNKDTTSRSTYAFADFANVSQAVHAMDNLDQSIFKGRKLVVTLTNPGAVYQQLSVEQIPNLTCKVTGDGDRNVYIKEMPPLSPGYSSVDGGRGMPLLSPGYNSVDGERGFDQSVQDHKNFNYQRLTTTLQDYTKICTKLRADCGIQMVEGMTLGVRVTHVENERFFWAQIREDSINGANRGLHNLMMLNTELQTEPKIEPISGFGRCMARYENEWFRGWCTFIAERNGQEVGDVLFIDYGNRVFAPKTEIIKTKSTLWSLPPMAKPFKIKDQKCDMGKYLDKDITLEVLEPGSHRTNSLTTVRLCWM